MQFRKYNPEQDLAAVYRIWQEVGWMDKGQESSLERFLAEERPLVAEVGGEVECLVLTASGVMRYIKEDLPASFVTGVTTSRVARKQGVASRLTASAIAQDAEEGALVSALGMFEQGYYSRLGFGTGGYEHRLSFDPADINVAVKARIPRRLGKDDWQALHDARLLRFRAHGGCNVFPAAMTFEAMNLGRNAFGLGYFDGPSGELSHCFCCSAESVGSGPYRVMWTVYQTREQFLELMALLKSLGDQVRLVRMNEPAGIQLQDLINRPFKHRAITENSRFEGSGSATAYWQMRICDLQGCLFRTRLRCEPIRFQLHLNDPIESYLEAGSGWRGIGGDYVVTLGPTSYADPGLDRSLPALTSSVGAFTRMWLGVRPASGLAITDELSGPPELLEALDWTLLLPDPKPDWDF